MGGTPRGPRGGRHGGTAWGTPRGGRHGGTPGETPRGDARGDATPGGRQCAAMSGFRLFILLELIDLTAGC